MTVGPGARVSARLEIAHALLDSVDGGDDDEMSAAERAKLDAAIERGLAEAEAGKGIPAEQVFRALRAKRAARAAR